MQHLEVSCAVRLIYMSLGAKGLRNTKVQYRFHKSPPLLPYTNSQLIYLRTISISSSHLNLGLQSGLIPCQNPVCNPLFPYTCHKPRQCQVFFGGGGGSPE